MVPDRLTSRLCTLPQARSDGIKPKQCPYIFRSRRGFVTFVTSLFQRLELYIKEFLRDWSSNPRRNRRGSNRRWMKVQWQVTPLPRKDTDEIKFAHGRVSTVLQKSPRELWNENL